jgi:proteic killer suppression protein
MDTEYSGDEICKLCQDHKYSVRKIGPMMTLKLEQRIKEISAADSLAVLKLLPGLHCHNLSGDRIGQWAVNLKQPKRLVFLPSWKDDGRKVEEVTKITLLEIVDYH